MHDVMELAEGFVDYKRSLGYVYPKQTVDLARQMARHLLEMPSDVVVTREAAESFSMRRDGEAASTQNKRASIIRQFSIYLQHIGIDCYVPEEGRGRRPQSDFAPRIISESEMARVIEAADAWPVKCRMRGFREAYASLIRLLWCCGLRLGEALSLRIADVDLLLQDVRYARSTDGLPAAVHEQRGFGRPRRRGQVRRRYLGDLVAERDDADLALALEPYRGGRLEPQVATAGVCDLGDARAGVVLCNDADNEKSAPYPQFKSMGLTAIST